MTVRIDEVSTVIEPTGGEAPPRGGESAGQSAPFEVQIEELRPVVRALVAEELERWLRTRGGQP